MADDIIPLCLAALAHDGLALHHAVELPEQGQDAVVQPLSLPLRRQSPALLEAALRQTQSPGNPRQGGLLGNRDLIASRKIVGGSLGIASRVSNRDRITSKTVHKILNGLSTIKRHATRSGFLGTSDIRNRELHAIRRSGAGSLAIEGLGRVGRSGNRVAGGGGGSGTAQLAKFIDDYNADAGNTDWTAALNDAGDGIKFTAKVAGDLGTTGVTPPTGTTEVTAGADAGAAGGTDGVVTGDYNKTTTVTKQGVEEAAGRIASGVATLTKDTFADGSIIKVGDKEYTVTTDAAKKGDADTIYVGDLALDTADGLKTAIDRLSVAADSNSVWTIGHGATAGQVTFVEKVDADGKSYTELNTENGKLKDGAFDLSKESVIKETFGTVTGKKEANAGKDGKPLTLQIGDTSDTFNQMEVNVGDMHTNAMGAGILNEGTEDEKVIDKTIADINIGTQEGAHEAIDVIKNAINYVSGVRGDLGAVQNRLEHTANNLSVMTENIQDAESTIRDTDVAEEMMAYTKNNILVQSAQAMLAQANAVPQGVLQLLG